MRIYHNKETNQVIIVTDNLAYSFYNYAGDHPVSAAREFIDTPNGLADLSSTCEEIELPAMDDKTTRISATIGPGPLVNKNGTPINKDKSCEHSQQKKKPR